MSKKVASNRKRQTYSTKGRPTSRPEFDSLEKVIEWCKQTGHTLAYGHGRLVERGSSQGFESIALAVAIAKDEVIMNDEEIGVPGWKASDSHFAYIKPGVVKELNALIDDEAKEVCRIVSKPLLRTFVYLDISDFSEFTPGNQATVLRSLIHEYKSLEEYNSNFPELSTQMKHLDAELCIGDGYIFVFRNCFAGVLFGCTLAELIDVANANCTNEVEYHFRMGIHMGEVLSFYDYGRNGWNFTGNGINVGNRVLATINKKFDDLIHVSDSVRYQIRQIARHQPIQRVLDSMDEGIMNSGSSGVVPTIDDPYLAGLLSKHMTAMGRHEDKHKIKRRVWRLNYTSFFEDLEALRYSLIKEREK